MPKVTIYHNPCCTKSRQTLALLQEHGIEPTIIQYLNTPPSASDLKNILAMLKQSPRELMRRKETLYKEQQLDSDALSDAELINVMVKHPILIERPIVVAGNKAAIGRPPENVLTII